VEGRRAGHAIKFGRLPYGHGLLAVLRLRHCRGKEGKAPSAPGKKREGTVVADGWGRQRSEKEEENTCGAGVGRAEQAKRAVASHVRAVRRKGWRALGQSGSWPRPGRAGRLMREERRKGKRLLGQARAGAALKAEQAGVE